MHSVFITLNYANSEELRSYLERHGFETDIIDRYTGDSINEKEFSTLLHTSADRFLISFSYMGDKFPPQRVFKKIFSEENKDGIIEFEASFGPESTFID